jgi:tRNA dimethylallyltransferase
LTWFSRLSAPPSNMLDPQSSILNPCIFLMGPTASGKTGVAVELLQHLPLEIVSVDSALVYRGMDIGTAKPDADTLARAPHHLIDILDPTEAYSAARFRQDALAAMQAITARGKIALLVGGTMLYFKALREGLSELPQADPALRADIERRAAQCGWPALHGELARLDPASAARLEPTDAQRIQRALEVCYLTDQPLSQRLLTRSAQPLPYRVIAVALVPSERAVLHRRIEQRFESMLAQGLIDEVVELKRCYALHAALPSMRCVGYRQVWQYLDGAYDRSTLRQKGVAATRQLAKRQLTWLRAMRDVMVFDCLRGDLSTQVMCELERRLQQ